MDSTLAKIGDDYFQTRNNAHPFEASAYGISGYADKVPVPSRDADRRLAYSFDILAGRLAEIDPATLDGTERVSHAMLGRLLRDQQATLRAGLTEVAVSASTIGQLSEVVAAVPSVAIGDETAAADYLTRLSGLSDFFDTLGQRYVQARDDGRFPTALGVNQAIAQIDGFLAKPVEDDPLLSPQPTGPVDATEWRAKAADLVKDVVRPALMRYRETLASELTAVGRADGEVGICHVPGGAEGYLAHVRADTTTELTPEQLHATGLELVAQLRDEFAERGAKALGTADVGEVLDRLRNDPALRFESAAQIVDTVTDVLRRAENELPNWFRSYDIAPCAVRQMDTVEGENAVLGYYMPPAADGSRPGEHVVNVYRPQIRTRFEYEALAIHESVPGHHLQIAVGQSLTELPQFRRFSYFIAHGEGWGLYSERLGDEMGLYTSELSRLGMVSFDAWRACRLVVDTGMHLHGWSRQRAIDYMMDNTALSASNIANEVDRYIAWPGQALAYMVGRLRINRARKSAEAALGSDFDIKAFHHNVLAHGSVPLDIMDDIIAGWVAQTSRG